MTPARSIEAPVAEAPIAPRRPSGVLRDTFTLSIIAGLVKLAGAAKSIAIARVFGSGPDLDAYLLAFLIPSMLADTFCGALVPVTVPRLIELHYREGTAAAQSFYARLFACSLRYSLAGAAVLAVAIGASLALGGAAGTRHLVAVLAVLMLPVIPCNAIANVWRAALNSENKFAAPAVTAVFTPMAISLAVLAIGRGAGAWILAVATTAGAAGELALLGLAMRQSSYLIFPGAPLRAAGATVGQFRGEYLYLAASGAVSGGAVAIGQAMASWLGPGSVSALNYGTRLSTVIMSIGPAALSVAILPRFSHIAAKLEFDGLKRALLRLMTGALAAMGGVAAVFFLCSTFIVRATLEHGAFTSADTQTVGAVQAWSLLQMPFMVCISIFMRIFSVLKANRVLLPLSGGALAINVALNAALMHRLGVAGIALASSIAQASLFAAMAWLVFGPPGANLYRRAARLRQESC